MITGRSIVARFNPEGELLSRQYLRRVDALFIDQEWEWTNDEELAYVFDSHAAADEAAKAHRYCDERGHWHTPWPLVLTSEGESVVMPGARHVTREIDPADVYADLERRHLA